MEVPVHTSSLTAKNAGFSVRSTVLDIVVRLGIALMFYVIICLVLFLLTWLGSLFVGQNPWVAWNHGAWGWIVSAILEFFTFGGLWVFDKAMTSQYDSIDGPFE